MRGFWCALWNPFGVATWEVVEFLETLVLSRVLVKWRLSDERLCLTL
jgi:hypothetical protein